jgi:hypothetical protein
MSPIDLDDPAVKLYLSARVDAFGRSFEKRRMIHFPHVVGRRHDTCHCFDRNGEGLTAASRRRLQYIVEQYGERIGHSVFVPDRCEPRPGTYPYLAWKELRNG